MNYNYYVNIFKGQNICYLHELILNKYKYIFFNNVIDMHFQYTHIFQC